MLRTESPFLLDESEVVSWYGTLFHEIVPHRMGGTAFMVASGDGHTNIVQLLLEHDADTKLQDKVSSSVKIVCECFPYCYALGTAQLI